MKPDIELHIDELVLHGFEGYSAPEIREAVLREIERQLNAGGLSEAFSADAAQDYLRTGAISIKAGAGEASVGAQIAQSVLKPLQTGQQDISKSSA